MRGEMPAFDGRRMRIAGAPGSVAFGGGESTAAMLTLSPGQWKLEAKGWANWSVSGSLQWCGMYLRLNNPTTGPLADSIQITYPFTEGAIPFALLAVIAVATPTTVYLNGAPSHPGTGTQLLNAGVLVATPV